MMVENEDMNTSDKGGLENKNNQKNNAIFSLKGEKELVYKLLISISWYLIIVIGYHSWYISISY